MNFKEIKLKNKQTNKKLWHHIRAMLPWTLKLNCKPYITYALLVYDLFSVEKTARVLKLVVEHWSFASCSHSSMFIKPVLVLNSVVHSVSRVYETCFSLLSLSLRFGGGISEGWNMDTIGGTLLCSPRAPPAGTSGCDWMGFSVESPSSNFVLQNWQRVMALTQSLQGLDVLLF